MKYGVVRVHGAQADEVKRIGLVKITRASAEALFDLGVPIVIAPNKINSYHFFHNFRLAMEVDSDRFLSEGWSFSSLVNDWSYYHENSETGKIAFFVEEKRVAPPASKKRRR